MNERLGKLKARWEAFSVREQALLLATLVCATLFVLLTRVWEPLSMQIDAKRLDNARLAENFAVMQRDAADLKLLRERARRRRGATPKNLNRDIQKLVREHGLRLSRFQPASGNKATLVWFKGVDFNKLVAWLSDVEGPQQINIKTLNISSAGKGRVNAQARLER